MTRCAAAAAVGMALSLITVSGAAADGIDELPPISQQELSESVHDIDTAVADIETVIEDVERTDDSSDDRVVLDSDILFGFDERDLTSAATDKVKEIIEGSPDGASVVVTGHTDDIGTKKYNDALSSDRAQAVGEAIEAARPDLAVTTRGRGSSDPVEPNSKDGKDNPEGRAKNRRVEITVD